MSLVVDSLVLGAFATNCYVLRRSAEAGECVLIDTGLESGPLVRFLQERELKPAGVLLTHGHGDHIAGLEKIRENWPDVEVAIHKNDAEMLTDAGKNLSLMVGMEFVTKEADFLLDEGPCSFGGFDFEVLLTPGHTPGSVCFWFREEGVLFSGDTLFLEGIGRSDFPGGDGGQLLASIREKLYVLPDGAQVYPGHGPETTIGHEKRYNPFVQ